MFFTVQRRGLGATAPVSAASSMQQIASVRMLALAQQAQVGMATGETSTSLVGGGAVERSYVDQAGTRAMEKASANEAAAGGAADDPNRYSGAAQSDEVATLNDATGGDLTVTEGSADVFDSPVSKLRTGCGWPCWLALAVGLTGGALIARRL